jgi:hypothetical protein
MAEGAGGIKRLIEREPLISLAALLAELPPLQVRRRLRLIRSALDALGAAFNTQHEIPSLPPADDQIAGQLEIETDPDADIQASARDLPAGDE